MNTQRFKPKAARRFATCIGAAAVALMTMGPVLAVDDIGLFELEGNALDDSGFATLPDNTPDDWQTLFVNGGHANVTTDPKPGGNVVLEDAGTVSIFTTGGSKDHLDIPNWKHKDGSVPDKDNILNAYAANYTTTSGEQIIYFGADRYANDGDANMGFWFFQSGVSMNPDGTFSGAHVNGDVLVLVEFTGGGDVTTEAVYVWDTSCAKDERKPTVANSCAAANLRIKIPQGPATCGASGGDLACAIANSGNETSPWSYTPKQGADGAFPDASFFEGGLNVSGLFGGPVCFASFLAETRSSSEPSAVLKDLVLGDFNVCSVAATKTCKNDTETDDTPPTLDPPADADITYNIRGCAINDGSGAINVTGLENSIGGGDLYFPPVTWKTPGQVTVNNAPVDFDPATDCGNKAKLEEAFDNGTPAGPNTVLLAGEALIYAFVEHSPSSGPSDVVTIGAVGTGGAPIDPATATVTCEPAAFDAAIRVEKSCRADVEDAGNQLVVRIEASGQVCNDGETQVTGVEVVDDPAFAATPEIAKTTLNPGQCTAWTGYYYPDTIPSGDICPFADTVKASAIAPKDISPSELCVELEDKTFFCESMPVDATCDLRIVGDDGKCETGDLPEASN